MVEVVNLLRKFEKFDEPWSPRVVGALNGQLVKVARLQGEYVWHSHDAEDELFLVVRGEMTMHLRDGAVNVREGEFVIVPRGVEHKPAAGEEAWVLLFEPVGTRSTGNVTNELTVEPGDLPWI